MRNQLALSIPILAYGLVSTITAGAAIIKTPAGEVDTGHWLTDVIAIVAVILATAVAVRISRKRSPRSKARKY